MKRDPFETLREDPFVDGVAFELSNGDRNLIVGALGLLLAEARKPGGAEYIGDADEIKALRDRIQGRS